MTQPTDRGNIVTIKRSIVTRHLLGKNTDRLYLTAGHEASHVGDWANGNLLKYRKQFLATNPNANHNTVVRAMIYQTEIRAYQWNVNNALRMNYRVSHSTNSLNYYKTFTMVFKKMTLLAILLHLSVFVKAQIEWKIKNLQQQKLNIILKINIINESSERVAFDNILPKMFYISQVYSENELIHLLDSINVDRMGFFLENEIGETVAIEKSFNLNKNSITNLFNCLTPSLKTNKIVINAREEVSFKTKIILKELFLEDGIYSIRIFYYDFILGELYHTDAAKFKHVN